MPFALVFSRFLAEGRGARILLLLNERELQVLHLLQSAKTSEEISRELFVSVNTTCTHIRNIYGKLAVLVRIEAIQKAAALAAALLLQTFCFLAPATHAPLIQPKDLCNLSRTFPLVK